MTSDAKIGLLLGLVFIFIIAFIINGLPKLRGQTDSNELTEIMMENNPPGLGAWERKADEVLNPPPQLTEQSNPPQFPSPEPAESFATDDSSGIRHSFQFREFDLDPKNVFADRATPGKAGPLVQEHMRFADYKQPTPPPVSIGERSTEPEKIDTPKPKPPKPATPKPKTYLVVSGDSLGSIAKKVYGPVEGNKRANVTKIFEANRTLLKSPDFINVGQKLVIPRLPKASVKKDKGLLSGSLFEKVKSMGFKATAEGTPAKESGRFYTVAEGDSLWAISAKQLGSGVRYKEISQLNSDVLPSEDDLRVGIRLRLPAQ